MERGYRECVWSATERDGAGRIVFAEYDPVSSSRRTSTASDMRGLN
jgi:hypothetical protein